MCRACPEDDGIAETNVTRLGFAGLAAYAVLGIALPAAASQTVLFRDDFDDEAPRLGETVSLKNWTVIGEIDVVDEVNPYGIVCSGRCIDLNGSAPGFVNMAPIAIAAGRRVTVSFDLSGNQRTGDTDVFVLNAGELGTQGVWDDFIWHLDPSVTANNLNIILDGVGGTPGAFMQLQIAGADPFRRYGFSFVSRFNVVMQLNMGSMGGTTTGPVLDNFLVTQAGVPEAASWAMLIAGLSLVGAAMRRRDIVVSA